MKKHIVFLHIGSNKGNRLDHLRKGIQGIESTIGNIVTVSSIYETEAWGVTEQADFLNQALQVETTLEPESVLEEALAVELQVGRQRTEKWHPRILDIDLLFYDSICLETPSLQLPHPHLQERNFVLIPMLEIAADYLHPILNKSIESLYWESKDAKEVCLFEHSNDEAESSTT